MELTLEIIWSNNIWRKGALSALVELVQWSLNWSSRIVITSVQLCSLCYVSCLSIYPKSSLGPILVLTDDLCLPQ